MQHITASKKFQFILGELGQNEPPLTKAERLRVVKNDNGYKDSYKLLDYDIEIAKWEHLLLNGTKKEKKDALSILDMLKRQKNAGFGLR
jgi:hypothetical protein